MLDNIIQVMLDIREGNGLRPCALHARRETLSRGCIFKTSHGCAADIEKSTKTGLGNKEERPPHAPYSGPDTSASLKDPSEELDDMSDMMEPSSSLADGSSSPIVCICAR